MCLFKTEESYSVVSAYMTDAQPANLEKINPDTCRCNINNIEIEK
jgi:hypothetical protein